MLQLFSVEVAEWPPVWERAVHLVYLACLLNVYQFCVCHSFPFDFGGWDVGFDCINS